MIEAVLFDLDDTLLGNNMERFIGPYFRALSARLAHLLPPDKLARDLIAATEEMIAQTGRQETNAETFWRGFERRTGIPKATLNPLTEEFYANDFGALQSYTRRRPLARPLVEYVVRSGRKAVIATNPLFPRRAVLHRLEWAGVADLPFALITTLENMHTTKPHPEYYAEIAAMLGTPTERCLMIGDDRSMDAPALQVGMRFFWVTEERPFDETRGDLNHLYGLVQDGLLER